MANSLKKFAFKVLGVKNYLRILQRGFFFSYNTGMLKNNPNYACHYFVKQLIREGDTVIDIGANLGYYSKLFSRWVGKSGKVYSVEPISLYNKIFKEATRNCKNITLLPFALGLEEKDIKLVTATQSGYLSTGLPHVYDPKRDGKMEEQEFTFDATMKIPHKLFGNMERIDYVKCDIEGFEGIVLSDMKDIFIRHKPIIQVELWEDNKVLIFELLNSIGYQSFRISPTERKLVATGINNEEGFGDYIFIHKNKGGIS